MSRPQISKLRTWEMHQKRVLEVLEEALLILRTKHNLMTSEVHLNRELYFCLLEANHKLWNQGRGFNHPPISEPKNPPDPEDEYRAPREDKIPDFLWGYIDHMELDTRRQARHFIIECKRLGTPPRADWVLNSNYINHGVLRFVQGEHAYAMSEKSAAMVGYVESMDFDAILLEVNAAGTPTLLPTLKSPIKGWQTQGVSSLEHSLTRLFSNTSLSLKHFWIDLRDVCKIPSPTRKRKTEQHQSK